jgi:hypothetical protein
MEVPLRVNAATLQPGTPHSLFSIPEDSEYEVFGDGKFLVNTPNGSPISSPIVVLNWQAALNSKKK